MNIFGINIQSSASIREQLDTANRRVREAEEKAEKASAKVRSNVVSIGQGNADTVAAFSRAIDVRAKVFAQACIEFQAYQGGTWKKAMRGDFRYLNFMLHCKPNSYQNAQEMWEMASRIADLSANGLCAIWAPGMSEGNIVGLYPCTANWNVMTNEYTVSNVELNIGGKTVPADEVIILRNGYGKSMVSVLRRQLEMDATADEFSKNTFAKGGTFKAIVKQEQTGSLLSGMDSFDDDEVEKNFEDINRQFSEGNDFIYDPSASQLFQIQQSYQDLQVNMSHDRVTHCIAMVTGVPQPLLFQNTNAVYKNTDDAYHVFTGMTCKPRWNAICQELNAKFLGEEFYDKRRFHPNTEELCLDSDKSKADTYSVLVNAGIMTQNEARTRYNLEAKDGGDTLKEPKSNTNTASNSGTSKKGGEE